MVNNNPYYSNPWEYANYEKPIDLEFLFEWLNLIKGPNKEWYYRLYTNR